VTRNPVDAAVDSKARRAGASGIFGGVTTLGLTGCGFFFREIDGSRAAYPQTARAVNVWPQHAPGHKCSDACNCRRAAERRKKPLRLLVRKQTAQSEFDPFGIGVETGVAQFQRMSARERFEIVRQRILRRHHRAVDQDRNHGNVARERRG